MSSNMSMRSASRLAALAGIAAAVAFGAEPAGITDNASAISAAKRYLKARCTTETPCKFKAEHEGKQWRVWVHLTKRRTPHAAPQPYPGGTLVLYFDANGNLTRRLEAD
jgi:hypothetical protein